MCVSHVSVDMPRRGGTFRDTQSLGDEAGAERVLFYKRSLRTESSVCVLECIFHTQPGFDNNALGFTSCWFRALRSATGENLEPFHVVSEDTLPWV